LFLALRFRFDFHTATYAGGCGESRGTILFSVGLHPFKAHAGSRLAVGVPSRNHSKYGKGAVSVVTIFAGFGTSFAAPKKNGVGCGRGPSSESPLEVTTQLNLNWSALGSLKTFALFLAGEGCSEQMYSVREHHRCPNLNWTAVLYLSIAK
jgi:hypothetical protein